MQHFERYGYPALALLVLLEGLGIPTPAVSVVVAAAALAAHGHMSLTAVVAVTLVAAAAGDNLGYLVGRRAGRPLLRRLGKRGEKAERFVATRGRNIIVVARFIDGLRQTNGLLAGATGLPWGQYAIRDGIGAVLWTALWVTVGAVAGNNLGRIERYRLPVAIAVGVVATGFLIWYLIKRRARGN
ncbi:DedA family protein [Dactylosporangium sp. NPDC051485]|uniref:DedA family protein n=1 Tax=Dactylosporangium sp. NPDC051485 TaxID=3154846 RepID=UPI003445E49E